MPDIAAEYGQSIAFLSCSSDASSDSFEVVCDLFSLVGEIMVVEDRLMDPGMMMAGCGFAYVMRFIRANMEAGVEMGFYPNDSLKIALQTVYGAVTLLNNTVSHPEALIDKVTTPGGTTIKGLNELDHSGFNSAVIRCMMAGFK